MPPTTRTAAEKLNREFTEWFERGQTEGSIPEDAESAGYMQEFYFKKMELMETRFKAEKETVEQAKKGVGDEQREHREEREQRERRQETDRHRIARVKVLKAQGAAITTIDGSDRGSLRGWLNQVDCAGKLARTSEEELIMFALTKATGPLHSVMFTAFYDHKIGLWEEVKTQITESLLTADEKSHLRAEVMKMVQTEEEPIAAYCNRFRIAVARAWNLKGVTKGTDTFDFLSARFLESLCDDTTAWHVDMTHPTTLEAAFKSAVDAGRAIERRADRVENKSNALAAAALAPVAVIEQKDISNSQFIKTLQGEVKALKKAMTTVQNTQGYRQPPAVESSPRAAAPPLPLPPPPPQQPYVGNQQPYVGNQQPYVGNQQPYVGNQDFRRPPPQGSGNRGYQAVDYRARVNHQNNDQGQVARDGGRPPMKCFGCGGPHPVRRCPQGQGFNPQRFPTKNKPQPVSGN
jgi:hypothetical protein